MSGRDPGDKKRSSLLSRALRAVRKVRPADSRDLAKALGLSLRGYQHFEAGGGQLNMAHVMRFSRAIDCDPIGILAAVQIRRPEFAAYVAQNKAMIAYMIALQEFVEETGEAITRLETTEWISAYREMFRGLSEKARTAQSEHDGWLTRNAARIGLAEDAPGAAGEENAAGARPAKADGDDGEGS